MVSAIEKITNKNELIDVCKKYNLVCIPQPSILLSRVAEILYKKKEDAKYAVCDSDARIELVRYENETELYNYCKAKGFDFLMLVNPDGSRKAGLLEQWLEEEK